MQTIASLTEDGWYAVKSQAQLWVKVLGMKSSLPTMKQDIWVKKRSRLQSEEISMHLSTDLFSYALLPSNYL